jgi:hypothetical protein
MSDFKALSRIFLPAPRFGAPQRDAGANRPPRSCNLMPVFVKEQGFSLFPDLADHGQLPFHSHASENNQSYQWLE